MVRGINKQEIFLSTDEKAEYLKRLGDLKQQTGIKILSYSIMDNHTHILLFEPNDESSISKLMHRLNCGYANWYNRKHGRIGPLFQDRFRSEAIQDDSQLLSVVRYIHQNPMKIGRPVSHWTSYNDYLSRSGITDTGLVLSMFNTDSDRACRDFIKFVRIEKEIYQGFIEPLQQTKTDMQIIKLVEEVVGQGKARTLIRLDKVNRDIQVRRLKEAGFSLRQIVKATGISKSVIARA